jgi:hypothetical protein
VLDSATAVLVRFSEVLVTTVSCTSTIIHYLICAMPALDQDHAMRTVRVWGTNSCSSAGQFLDIVVDADTPDSRKLMSSRMHVQQIAQLSCR